MKNNKIFSTLLLATTLTAMVAGVFSINSNVHRKVEAAVTYKTIYLSIPGTQENPGQVTKRDGSGAIKWDKNEKLAVNEAGRDTAYEAGYKMGKIDNQLYAYTLTSSLSSSSFNFTAEVDGVMYYSVSVETGSKFKYSDITNDGKNFIVMNYYNVGVKTQLGTRDSVYSVNNAGKYAKTFLAVVSTGVCDNPEGVDFDKLKAVWSEMGALVQDSFKSDLVSASIEGDNPINKFAALYNYIYWKYGNSVGSNFLNREITSLASVARYNPVITDNNVTTNVVVVSSISLVSLSIIGIYFYIRKRKEDK